MSNSPRSVMLEIALLIGVSALLGMFGVTVALLIGDLAQGRGLNFAGLTRSDSIGSHALGVGGLAGTAIIWYVRRGTERPYRYWDGVLWGVVCYALTATVMLMVSLPSVLQDSVLGLIATLLFLYIVGGLFALPAIFTVAPLALWCWHRVVLALR